MATFFNQTVRNINTAEVTAVTSSSDTTIVLSILIANKNAAAQTVTTIRKDASNNEQGYLAYGISVPAGSSVDLLSNKYIFPSGHTLRFSSSTSGTLDAQISYVVL